VPRARMICRGIVKASSAKRSSVRVERGDENCPKRCAGAELETNAACTGEERSAQVGWEEAHGARWREDRRAMYRGVAALEIVQAQGVDMAGASTP
jgi:hypothetical protein